MSGNLPKVQSLLTDAPVTVLFKAADFQKLLEFTENEAYWIGMIHPELRGVVKTVQDRAERIKNSREEFAPASSHQS